MEVPQKTKNTTTILPYRKQYGGSSKKQKYNYHIAQPYDCWAYF
jgi:hypothetical protein